MRTIEQIIDREVFMNVSQLISNVVYGNTGYMDEFLQDQENMTDWDALIEQLESEVDEDEINEWLDYNGYESLEDALKCSEYDLSEFAEDNDVYQNEHEHEIFEYWAISDWLHGILVEVGYPVSVFQGMNIMCRYTTGQSLSMDYVWQQVQTRMMERVSNL